MMTRLRARVPADELARTLAVAAGEPVPQGAAELAALHEVLAILVAVIRGGG
jgi:hypothetical protein